MTKRSVIGQDELRATSNLTFTLSFRFEHVGREIRSAAW